MAMITAYNPLPISFTHGKGVWLFDKEGNEYLDAFSGIAVCGLGHAHPAVTSAISAQAEKLVHVSNMVHIDEQESLAKKLLDAAKMEQVFFSNSGAEANEAAIKLTRLFGHAKGISNPEIIVMEGAFHGRTMATLTASGSRKVQAGFEPLVPGFIRAPFNSIDSIKTIAENRDDIVAIMLEPIQGEGGIIVADEMYLRELRKICDKNEWLLIFDEIQTGVGRTGALYTYLDLGITPDIVTTAKGLGNGMPIGACMMSQKACDLLKPGTHGSTFGGNPLACKTAEAVLDVISENDICNHVKTVSKQLRELLAKELGEHPNVISIRGKGLMLGIELNVPAVDIRKIGLKNGILLNVTAEKIIRLLPPLIISETEIVELVQRLVKSIREFVV